MLNCILQIIPPFFVQMRCWASKFDRCQVPRADNDEIGVHVFTILGQYSLPVFIPSLLVFLVEGFGLVIFFY